MKEFKIRATLGNYPTCWLIQEADNGKYLHKDGTINEYSVTSGSGDEVAPKDLEQGWYSTKQEAEDFLAKWLSLELFNVRKSSGGDSYWISKYPKEYGQYLHKDGKIKNTCYPGDRWKTKESAEQFLEQWKKNQFKVTVKGSEMNKDLQSRLHQAKLDKQKIDDNINAIKQEIKAEMEAKETEDCYVTGVYERNGIKYFLGFANDELTLYGHVGHWITQSFMTEHSGHYRNVKTLWRIIKKKDKDYMRKYTYVGDL